MSEEYIELRDWRVNEDLQEVARTDEGNLDWKNRMHRHDAPNVQFGYAPNLNRNDVQNVGGKTEEFLEWCLAELMREKLKSESYQWRHNEIFIIGSPHLYVADIEYRTNECLIDESAPPNLIAKYGLGTTVQVMTMWVLTDIMHRNPIFTRLSFSADDSMWDELGDLL
jgi:hypothetical protein